MEYWHGIETTSSGQPVLRETEKDILIDYNVGLYLGKERIKGKQNGRIFLTSQRIVYVDDLNPNVNSAALELDDIESIDYSSSFLKRSARLIIFMKLSNTSKSGNSTPLKVEYFSKWECPICMFANVSQGKFEQELKAPPICKNCGVPAEYEMIKDSLTIETRKLEKPKKKKENSCPSCTFINSPFLKNCEMCGTRLPSHSTSHPKVSKNMPAFVQISFRKSDGILFAESTTKIFNDLKKRSIFNKDVVSVNGVTVKSNIDSLDMTTKLQKMEIMGINGLEKLRETQLVNNDILFNNALQDLDKLMSLANNIERLYQAKNKLEGNARMKNKGSIMIDREKFLDNNLFLDEIAREIYEFAISEFKDQNNENNIMITLVDLYAMYNKSMRIGTGLISPHEMKEACERFGRLGLNELKLVKINKRVLCLSSTNSFKFIEKQIINSVELEPGSDLLRITQVLNSSSKDNVWTIGVIIEVLQHCIDNGKLLIDEQMSGIYYYKNTFWK